jgi:tetratricopeptide (TPR) repeat protein
MPPLPGPPPERTADERAAAVHELGRVLSSEAFRRSPRSRSLLAYVVTETLAGRGDRLSERTVARRALQHGPAFDGRTDASVRVRATRVRAALQRYYATEGQGDQLQIQLPPGGYVPVFVPRQGVEVNPSSVPGVAVLEFTSAGDPTASEVASSLTDALTNLLTQSVDVRVVGPTSPRNGDVAATGRALGVSSVLEGRVTISNGQARAAARLVASATAEVLWSFDDVADAADLGALRAEDTWSRLITAQVADAAGVVVRHQLRAPAPPATSHELRARLAFYSYLERGTAQSVAEAAQALDEALDAGPRTAALLTMRAAIVNASISYDPALDLRAELQRVAALVGEALTLDGNYVHAYLVLAAAAGSRQRWQQAVEEAEKAVALAPDRPSYLVGAGITMCAAGEWDRGAALIERALHLYPSLPGHMHTWLAVRHLVQGDAAAALAEASLLPTDGYVWGPLYRAMALSGLGYLDEAREELAEVRRQRPDMAADPGVYLSSRMNLTDAQLTRMVRSITRLAG